MLVFLEILLGMGALSLAAAWLSVANLRDFALQAFAVAAAVYIVVKKVSKDGLFYSSALEKAAQVYKEEAHESKKLPVAKIISLAILGFAVMLLVGYFGGLHSAAFSFTFVYIFFLAFSTGALTTVFLTLFMLGAAFYLTPNVTSGDFAYPVLALVFMGVVMLAKRYYDQSIIKQHSLKLEREKVSYYNIYAENQLNEALRTQRRLRELSKSGENTRDFVTELIVVVDDLAKKSRHATNQMVVSQELSKVGLNLRRFQSGLISQSELELNHEKVNA